MVTVAVRCWPMLQARKPRRHGLGVISLAGLRRHKGAVDRNGSSARLPLADEGRDGHDRLYKSMAPLNTTLVDGLLAHARSATGLPCDDAKRIVSPNEVNHVEVTALIRDGVVTGA